MRQVLTSPEGGYYTSRTNVFGKHGDFVTSPEISQVFGELVGIWTIAEWMAQGRKRSGVQLMEVGPGKGTLMDDMLRVSLWLKDGLRIWSMTDLMLLVLDRRSGISKAFPLVWRRFTWWRQVLH